jgi:hypothetical protein
VAARAIAEADAAATEPEAMRRILGRLGRTLLARECTADDVRMGLAAVLRGSEPSEHIDPADVAAAAGLLFGCVVLADGTRLSGPAITYAAAAAALARVRTTVVCADAARAKYRHSMLLPLSQRLGFSVGGITPADTEIERRRTYSADVVCVSLEQIALDRLHDQRTCPRATRRAWRALSNLQSRFDREPILGGRLDYAIVEGARRVLLEKSALSVVLHGRSDAFTETAFATEAVELAASMGSADFTIDPQQNQARLTEAGRYKLAERVLGLQGAWASEHRRILLVERSLLALHRWQKGSDYAVERGRVVALDPSLQAALNVDRDTPRMEVLLAAASGQLSERVPVAQALCHRVLGSHHRLAALGVGGSGLARAVR